MKLIILFAVAVSYTQAVQGAINLGIPFRRLENKPLEESPVCKKPGLQCSDCSTTMICIDQGDDQWEHDVIEHCDESNGYYCLDGQCTNSANPACGVGANVIFPCTAIGVFPDPFDCQMYHICCEKATGSSGYKCDEDHMYDPLTTYCKTKLPSTGCPSKPPVPLCKNPGDSGALLKNKSIYYVCSYVEDSYGITVLYPKLHVCSNGKIYHDDLFGCK